MVLSPDKYSQLLILIEHYNGLKDKLNICKNNIVVEQKRFKQLTKDLKEFKVAVKTFKRKNRHKV